MFKHIDTVIIRVPDEVEAASWYGSALGLGPGQRDAHSRTVTFALDGNTSLTLWAANEQLFPGPSRSYPIFYAADAGQAHGRLVQAGVSVSDIEGDEGFRSFRLWDPYGTMLEVCSYVRS